MSIKENVIKSNDWKMDSLGCLRLRCKNLSELMILENDLEKKRIKEFYKVFGRPNKQKVVNNETILMYYYGSMCIKGKIPAESDFLHSRISLLQE